MLENMLVYSKNNDSLSSKSTNEYGIPDTALQIIEEFETALVPYEPETATPLELVVDFSIPVKYLQKSLAYALSSGTAYLMQDGNIYIWYNPITGIRPTTNSAIFGWYKLKRFFIYDHGWVKYILDKFDKLPNS